MKRLFRSFAAKVSIWAGSPLVFISAILIIVLWAVSGPSTNYSDTWQLVINTGTTIVTFLMVFLIQNTQNRDGKAVQLKLDELIRSNKQARDSFLSLEDISDEELVELAEEFRILHERSMTTPAMRKLHKKIESEHAKRLGIVELSSKVVESITDPFNTRKTDKEAAGRQQK
jgi:low affinity Fe/Cu permease